MNICINKNINVLEFAKNQIHALSEAKLQICRLLHVRFVNEQGADAGGLSKEWFAPVTEELKTPKNSLFLPLETKSGVKYDPNPQATTPEHLSTLNFIGKFLGLAILLNIKLDIDILPLTLVRMLGIKIKNDDKQ